MDTIYLIVLLSLSMSPWLASSKITEILVRDNGAANFYLPASRDCGQYNLTDRDGSVVLTVSPDASTTISRPYANRSTASMLANRTVVYTLHYITWRDEGTFMTQSLDPDCMWYITVSILKDASRIAFWEKWNSWSICGSTCGSGVKIRERECNIRGRCHGRIMEEESCNSEFDCPSLGDWGSWSSCSVSCGRGEVSRHRQCHSDVGECVGELSQIAACTLQPCAYWTTWTASSSCSSSCGPGHTSRRRQCMVGSKRAQDSRCSGNPADTVPCTLGPCKIQESQYIWSNWSSWSMCSTSCGRGNQTRMRSCLLWDSQRRMRDEMCDGEAKEVQECRQLQCLAGIDRTESPDLHSIISVAKTTSLAEVPVDTSVDKQNTETPVPYTTIVGGAAAGFIIILLLVIIVLLVRMKKRKDTTVRRRTIYDLANRQSKQVEIRGSRSKSNAGRSVTESRMYAEIDDDFIDSEFDATSCNDYGPLPSSASPHGTDERTKKNSADQDTGEGNIFVFDAPAVSYHAQLRVPKISSGVSPRQGNAGGDGYEKPISCSDRQRKMVYANVEYSNVIR